MNNLREHSTVNDVVENVLNGNVKLQYNEPADFVYFSVVGTDAGTPNTVIIRVPEGAIKVNFDIPNISTHGLSDDPAYIQYWEKIIFSDGSYLAYFPETEWTPGDPQRLIYMGGIVRFYQKTGDTYTMSEGGTWGTSTNGNWSYWEYDPDNEQWIEHLELFTDQDKYMFYIWYDPTNSYKIGYGISGLKIGSFDLRPLYGTANKDMPIVQWAFVNGWEELYDYLGGSGAEGIKYPGEDSETGGGHGSFYNYNEDVDFPLIPSLQAIDLGFTTIYNPHEADVRAIAHWLWSDQFSDNIKMNYTDPFNNILGINFLAVPENLIHNELSNFIVGNCDSGIQTLKISTGNKNQYLELDCGERVLPEYWQNFLDYNSSFQIWLPYIGFRQLRPDDILQATRNTGGSLKVKYIIDLLTGCAVCNIVSILKDRRTGKLVKHLLYSYSCNCFYSTPISGANFMSLYNQQLSATTSGISNLVSSIGQMASGNIGGAVSGLVNLFTGQAETKRQYETAKPEYGRAGNSGGNAGYFSYKQPYIIKTNPIEQTPKNYNKMEGVPSMIYADLSSLEGYTEVSSINLDSLNASSAEKSELLTIMKSGFYI